MEDEHGRAALDLMRRVKAAFDPQNLFNPGKVFADLAAEFPLAPRVEIGRAFGRGLEAMGSRDVSLKRRRYVKTAVLAWGSLVWDPRELKTAAEFVANGPLLPIEFCRVSADGRLTLVDRRNLRRSSARPIPRRARSKVSMRRSRTSESGKETDARSSRLCRTRLRQTERRRHATPSASCRDDRSLGDANGYDAAIWTALASNFGEPGKGGEPFSVTAAIRYLETLEGQDAAEFARALDYIRKAPPEVETPVRDEVAKRWPA